MHDFSSELVCCSNATSKCLCKLRFWMEFIINCDIQNLAISAMNSHQFFLPHQNLAKSHHLSSGAKDLKPLKYINTDIREQNIFNYD